MQNIILENRKKVTLTGVKDVLNYNEESISIVTELGTMTIKGKEMHIDTLTIEKGDMTVSGQIDSMVYAEIKSRGSAFKNLFK